MIQSGQSCGEMALQLSAARKLINKTLHKVMVCSLMEAINKT